MFSKIQKRIIILQDLTNTGWTLYPCLHAAAKETIKLDQLNA